MRNSKMTLAQPTRAFKMPSSITFGIISISLILLNGCGTATDSTVTTGSFTDVYKNVIQKTSCNACHGTGLSANVAGATLDFSTQALAYQTLTAGTVSSTDSVGTCGSVKIVSAGNLDKSYLVPMLISSYKVTPFAGTTSCAPFDHLSYQNLTDSQQTSVKTWITNGAQND